MGPRSRQEALLQGLGCGWIGDNSIYAGAGQKAGTERVIQTMFSPLLHILYLTNGAWLLMWLVFSATEVDLKDGVNGDFMEKFKFHDLYDIYNVLRISHVTLIVMSVLALLFDCKNRVARLPTKLIHTNADGQKVMDLMYGVVLHRVALVYNIALLMYMLIVGRVLIQLVQIVLPILLVRFLAWFPYGTSLLVASLLPLCWILYRHVHTQPSSTEHTHNDTTSLTLTIKISLIVYHVLAALVVMLMYTLACQDCAHTLPTKPLLTAHRGCAMDAPENTLHSFELSTKIPSVITLESDVRISADGELFLLHDQALARTTNILSACPHIDPHTSASYLDYHSGKCPLAKLSVKTNPSLRIPTFDELLGVARQHGKNVIFDLSEPHSKHPYREKYIHKTLEVIAKSDIQLDKIWWQQCTNLTMIRKKYPSLTVAAKSSVTTLEEFKSLHIEIANEEFSTPPSKLRLLKKNGLHVNMYTINSYLMFEYAWCIGVVDSVTTDNCRALDEHVINHTYLACSSLSLSRIIIEAIVSYLVFCYVICSSYIL